VVRRQSISKRQPIALSGTKSQAINPHARVIADRFRLDSPIARSVNGEVHQAFDLKTGSVVAVKLLQSRFMAGENFGVRLRREFEVLHSLDHPSVVKVIDCGEASDRELYLAMEYVKGTTLETLIKRDGPMKPNKLAAVVSQVSGALDAAHSTGVVHRDVNPANILVNIEADGRTTVKLLDFGLAKMLEPEDTHHMNVTGAAMIVGRAEFMAPEQAGGDPVSASTDIYSLGLTSYYALTGRAPFQEASEIETLLAQLKRPIPPFVEMNSKVQIPAAVEEVVRKALSKKESDRHRTAGEFAAAFCHAAGVAAPVNRVEVKSIEFRAGVKRHQSRNWNKLIGTAIGASAVLVMALLLLAQLKS
jgi:serine/threonine protein kinase